MKYLEIKENNISHEICVPENWNELTSDQVIYIAKHWRAWQLLLRNNIDMQKARALLFIKLIKGKSKRQLRHTITLMSKINYEEIDWSPLSVVDFVFSSNELTVNPVKVIGSLFSRFYGPDDALKNISVHEFSYALNFYNRYNKTEDYKDLDLMISCLYRKKIKNWELTGDIRERFNPNTADRHLKKIAKIPYATKEAVFIFFAGCIQSWSKRFPLVFQKSDESEKPSNKTFIDVILMMSGNKFGTFDQTKEIGAYMIIKEVNNLIEDKIKAEKKR